MYRSYASFGLRLKIYHKTFVDNYLVFLGMTSLVVAIVVIYFSCDYLFFAKEISMDFTVALQPTNTLPLTSSYK